MEQIRDGYTRVTEVLSPYNDFSKVPPQTLKNKQRIGSLVHDFCEAYVLDLLIEPVPEEIKFYFNCFTHWFDFTVDKVINAEERLYSNSLYITGKYDTLVTLKGSSEIVLLDYKTCLATSKTWQLQTAAYDLLLLEDRGFKIDRRCALKLDGKGASAKLIEYTDHVGDRAMFLNVLRSHRFFNS